MLIAHGGFDFAETYDRFAPLLADGGWRVVSWDQRGHGDSAHAELYSWDADLRDAVAVLRSVTSNPLPVLGHSKGGGLMMNLAEMRPDLVSAVINLDGLPSKRSVPDIADHERSKLMVQDLTNRFNFRRRAHEEIRRPGTLEGLAERRGRMNPRLPTEWLQYLVSVGAKQDEEGWRWKLDPSMKFGGFGPNRPEWGLGRMASLGVPLLAVLGSEVEEMGWGTKAEDVEPWLPHGAKFEVLEGVGHFVHIEQPRLIADMTLEFLG